MKIAETISVNPGKATLGHQESVARNLLRSSVIDNSAEKSSIDILSFIFPSTGSGVTELKKYALPLRALFATILIVTGLTFVENPALIHGSGFGIVEIVIGGLLAIGFLTRPIMAGASVYFAIVAALSIRNGLPDMSTLTLLFGTLLFCVLGSGKYSLDSTMRSLIGRAKKTLRQKKANEAAGYKAFHYAK